MLLFDGFMVLLLKLVRYVGYLSAVILLLWIWFLLNEHAARLQKESEVESAKSKKTRVKYADDVEGEGKDKESQLMSYGEECGDEECDDENMARDAKRDVVEGSKLSKEDGRKDNPADDDWEGIERSELEKLFAGAVNYVEYGGKTKDEKLMSLGSDVQMQLYGLHKLALEGPCHEPQPMALKVSARAKWNAWQRLGSMSPEAAMEEYIKILSDKDPGWMLPFSAKDDKDGPFETGVCGSPDSKSSSLREPQAKFEVRT